MIGFLRGKLEHKAPPQLVLDVQGVGYELDVPMSTFYDLPALGEDLKLFTHLVVREDAHVLFGFATETERLLFRALIKVNGVGPKMALTILSGQSVEDFYRCINDNDVKTLVRLPGVGQKTAERLLVEMRGRLPELNGYTNVAAPAVLVDGNVFSSTTAKQEAISALCALGYKPQDASRLVQAVATEEKSCEDMIRLALRSTVK